MSEATPVIVAPQKTRKPKAEQGPVTLHKNVPRVAPSSLKHIKSIDVVKGMVKITTDDGKVHMKQAEELQALALNCELMLKSMMEAEQRGTPVPQADKRQTQDLIIQVTEAYRKAKYQQETALRLDKETLAVKRVTENLMWQNGGLQKERGEFSDSVFPEEKNIRYYKTRFPLLTEGEISGMLRNDRYPDKFRLQVMQLLHGKRMQEESKMNAKDIQTMLEGGAKAALTPKPSQ